jgi:hypothetical protein
MAANEVLERQHYRLLMGGLPDQVQHLQTEGGELQTHGSTSGRKVLQCDISSSP